MGKATILSHLGEGQYRIRIKFDNTLIELRKTYIDQQIVAINTELTTLDTQKLAAKAQYDADIAALNDYIDNTPVQDYVSNPTDINALTVQVYKSRFAYDAVIRLEKHAKLKRTQLSKDKDYLINYCPADYETSAWCTEYKTDLSGDVNTIEIDYGHRRDPFTDVTKNDTGFWIVNDITYPQTGNNQLQHPFESSVHACWYNLAMLPAMQRDKALFRVATILDKATGFIEFDGQSEPNNFDPVLITEKPVFPEAGEYLTGARLEYPCEDKYVNGDRVIVEMQPADSGSPRVIGFHDHPKQCDDGGGGSSRIWGEFSIWNTPHIHFYIIDSGSFDYDEVIVDPGWDASDSGIGASTRNATGEGAVTYHFYQDPNPPDPRYSDQWKEAIGYITIIWELSSSETVDYEWNATFFTNGTLKTSHSKMTISKTLHYKINLVQPAWVKDQIYEADPFTIREYTETYQASQEQNYVFMEGYTVQDTSSFNRVDMIKSIVDDLQRQYHNVNAYISTTTEAKNVGSNTITTTYHNVATLNGSIISDWTNTETTEADPLGFPGWEEFHLGRPNSSGTVTRTVPNGFADFGFIG